MIICYLYWWIIRQVDVPHPARTLNLTAKLKDTANSETPQLSFQHKAAQDFHSRQADKNDPPTSTVGANPNVPSQLVQCQLHKTSITSLLLLTTTMMMKMELSISQHHVCHLHVLSLLSHFGAFFTAKKRYAMATTSQMKRMHVMSVTVYNVDMTDAEGDIHDKGIVFLNHDVCQLNWLLFWCSFR